MSKTSISILQEIIVKRGEAAAQYSFIEGGLPHKRTYICNIKALGITESAAGSTKKDAKQNAASKLLELTGLTLSLCDKNCEKVSNNKENSTSSSSSNNLKNEKADSEAIVNYIGELNEYCAKNKLPDAHYNNETNDDADTCYKVVCKFLDLEKVGFGISKKNAKQQAAKEMFLCIKDSKNSDKIKSMLQEPVKEEIHSIEEVVDKYEQLKLNLGALKEKKKLLLPVNMNNNEQLQMNTWQELSAFLSNQNWKHKLTVLQSSPLLVMALQINSNYLLKTGHSRKEVEEEIIEEFLWMYNFGFEFDKAAV